MPFIAALILAILGTGALAQAPAFKPMADGSCAPLNQDASTPHLGCAKSKHGWLGYFDNGHTQVVAQYVPDGVDRKDLSGAGPVVPLGQNPITPPISPLITAPPKAAGNAGHTAPNYAVDQSHPTAVFWAEGKHLYVVTEVAVPLVFMGSQDSGPGSLLHHPLTFLSVLSSNRLEIEVAFHGRFAANQRTILDLVAVYDAQDIWR